ncbi:MAG: protein-disulfide reductase DsbD family protein [Candidatus Binatia bacterium]
MRIAFPTSVPALLALAVLTFVEPAPAAVVTSGNVTAELVSECETVRPGEAFTVGISLRPSPDWHTYWRNPGDSGLPTTVDWKLPPGLSAGELEWPHPVRLGQSPYVTYGYDGDVLLLARIEVPATFSPGSDVEIGAATRWLACRDDACVPGKADLSLRVPVEAAEPRRDPRWSAAFDESRAKLPRTIEGCSATVSESDGKVRVEVSTPEPRPPASGVEIFPTTSKLIQASAATTGSASADGFVFEGTRDERGAPMPDVVGLVLVADEGWDAKGEVRALRVDARRTGAADAAAGGTGAAATSSTDGAATAGDGAAPGAATEGTGDAAARSATTQNNGGTAPSAPAISGTQPDAARPIASPDGAGADNSNAAALGGGAASGALLPGADDVTFWAAVGLAFLGGIILNLMPCVFPVLSLKVLGFLHIAHHEAAAVRRHGYAFAAGVIVSFWILAGALLILRAAGGVFGWGFQLQEPIFVAAVAALLLAMSLNLLGVFEFGSSVSGAIGRFDSRDGYRGSFLSGVLATVLATPCTAPFMGTALGFALVQPPAESLAVFTSLGAGMASPYVLLACVPALLKRLPRPGAWMETFRAAMAFPLLATVAWLVWVFGQQTGNDGVLGLLLALLLGSMAAWLGGHFDGGRARTVARALGGLCLVAAAFLAVSAASPGASTVAKVSAADDSGGVSWLSWDPDAIDGHRRDGRVVFVDFTADWCLSCKVNERVALAGDEFADTIRTHEAIVMKADWTRADPRITDALASFGRSGVPLYVVYPRNLSLEPIVLPQILTPGIVRDALARAAA